MANAVLGMIGTGEFTSEMRPTNFNNAILHRSPDADGKFAMLLSMLKQKTTDDPTYNIFEGDYTSDSNPTTGTHDVAVTQINLDFSVDTEPAKKFKVADTVQNNTTGEVMLVTGLDQTNWRYITVVRGFGGTTATAMAAGEIIALITSSAAEGADVPNSITTFPTTVQNYTQIIRSPMEVTGTAMETYLRTGRWSAEGKWQATVQQQHKIERMLLFGRKATTTIGTEDHRYSGGLEYWVTSNVVDFSDPSTPFTRENIKYLLLQPPMTYTGSSENKICLAGATAYAAFTEYAEQTCGGIHIVPTSRTYGLHIVYIITPWGKLHLMMHPLMTRNTAWSKQCFVVDMNNVAFCTMKNRQTKWLKDRQSPGADKVILEWLGEHGLWLVHEGSHAIGKNIEAFQV